MSDTGISGQTIILGLGGLFAAAYVLSGVLILNFFHEGGSFVFVHRIFSSIELNYRRQSTLPCREAVRKLRKDPKKDGATIEQGLTSLARLMDDDRMPQPPYHPVVPSESPHTFNKTFEDVCIAGTWGSDAKTILEF